jgi:calcineurin-like phosphoesterase family protein
MTIFFTSDLHFGHDNIRAYCNRPFSSVEEMNQVLVDNWNKKVTDEDTIYILGDFAFGSHQFINTILHSLNGIKYFVFGNHDKSSRNSGILGHFINHDELNHLDRRTGNIRELTITTEEDEELDADQVIVMCHYPFEVWPKKHYGSIHLHGHSHGRLVYRKGMEARVDVGVDCWNYAPASWQEVKSLVTRRMMGLEKPNAELSENMAVRST